MPFKALQKHWVSVVRNWPGHVLGYGHQKARAAGIASSILVIMVELKAPSGDGWKNIWRTQC